MSIPEHGTHDRYVSANTDGSGGGGVGTCAENFVANDGTTNGVTSVVVLGPPVLGHQQRVILVTVCNRDTVPTVVALSKVTLGGTREVWSGTLYVGDTLLFDDFLVLGDVNATLELVLAAPVATNELDWTANAVDSVVTP